jgi:hypothetical protein
VRFCKAGCSKERETGCHARYDVRLASLIAKFIPP